jgi:hypothetical protein
MSLSVIEINSPAIVPPDPREDFEVGRLDRLRPQNAAAPADL